MNRRFAFALLLSIGLAACSPGGGKKDTEGGLRGTQDAASAPGGDGKVPGSAGVVNVYSSRHYDTDQAVFDRFTAETGIQVRQIQGKAEELQARLVAEGKDSPADLVITVDAGNLWRLRDAQLLQPVTSPVLEGAVPRGLRSEDGSWYAFTRRARVIAYDRSKVQPSEVANYDSLTRARFKGKVCVRPASNIYNLSLLGAIIERRGVDEARKWVEGMVNNFARRPEGNDTDQLRAVAAGVCQVAIVNHYYLVRLSRSTEQADKDVVAKIALSFPDQALSGTHINVSGAGVARNAPNRANAQRLLEFLVSPEAQMLLAKGNDEFPASPGAPTDNPELDALGPFKADPVELESYGRNQETAANLFNEVGWP
jgi:iron(III) transport system substrate-binding protein